MGSLLAVQMIPRSLFMLVGGALTDRFSPRNVMQVSVIARFILVGISNDLDPDRFYSPLVSVYSGASFWDCGWFLLPGTELDRSFTFEPCRTSSW